jgi:DNA-binding GntR family transcriptional regulator
MPFCMRREASVVHGGPQVITDEDHAPDGSAAVDDGAVPLADAVYRDLRLEILRGLLRPNAAVVESEVAERLQVSRTPVRESIQRLAAEGFIVSRRRRWYVYEHTESEIVEIYEARAALESYASRLAAERASAPVVQQVRHLAQPPPPGRVLTGIEQVEANDRFHDLILVAADNRRIRSLIEGNRQFHFNFRIADSYTAEEVDAWHAEHARIAEAIAARDGELAEALSREHVLRALKIILTK